MKISGNHKSLLSSLCAMLFFPAISIAGDLSVSGYASIIGGKVIDGESTEFFTDELGRDCPCYIANYTQVGIYEDDGIDFRPDSAFGINFNLSMTEALSAAVQVEAVGADEFQPKFTWAYFRYQITDNLSIDAGKKALPLYFYSDFINVGYAYPWVRPSGDIYGWPIGTYDGLSLNYMLDTDHGSFTINAWYGEEEDENNREYNDIYYVSENYYMKWYNMLGLAVEYEYDWLTLRLVAMTNKSDEIADYGDGDIEVVADGADQDFWGFALNIDYNDFLVFSEYNEFKVTRFSSDGYYVSLGYRFGDVTPLFSYSRYSDYDADFGSQINITYAFTLRWDFKKNAAFKFQYDRLIDKTRWPYYSDELFTGDAEVATMGLEYVF